MTEQEVITEEQTSMTVSQQQVSVQPSTQTTFTENTEASRFSFSDGESHSKSTVKVCFSFMEKRQEFRIIVDEVDLTPDNIVDSDFVIMDENFTHAAFESRIRNKSEMGLKSAASKSQDRMKVYATTIDLDDIHIDYSINTEEGYPPADVAIDQAPSAFYLPKERPLMSHPPEIFVCLKETETTHLFDLPTFSFDKGTPEGTAAEEENEYYQYITAGKGRNRKMVIEETQTRQGVSQTRHTLSTRPNKKNATAFASVWDMLDTYAQLAQVKEEEEEDEMVMYQSAAAYLLRKKRLRAAMGPKRAKTFYELAETPQYNDAILVTERVIASKEYAEAQKKFRGLAYVDPLSPDLIYIYSMKPLWTLECPETLNRPITGISFNPKNPDILAVGHGKFGYAEQLKGIVCIWCTKNPIKPERLYRFEDPITSVAFSEKRFNWLACGFANGDVCILDITSYTVKMIARSKRETNPCFEPIWVANWCALDGDNEFVMTAGQDGRISRFTSTKTHDFICTPMMRISTVEGKMKGLETTKSCLKIDVPITRYPAALCMKWYPAAGHLYLVGTDEGCIHKCSTHYLNQHMDVFRAHAGPVYSMEFNPFMKSLLVSCGADNAIRLWIDHMDDVIMTLNCPAAVYGIAFCPINSTILISVSGNVLSVWDLRRKTHIPCAEYSFPGNVVLTYVKFSASGDNVFVGDSYGRIHTFHLEDTPIPPYYQRKMLDEAIKKALCTRPQLLKQLEKLDNIQKNKRSS